MIPDQNHRIYFFLLILIGVALSLFIASSFVEKSIHTADPLAIKDSVSNSTRFKTTVPFQDSETGKTTPVTSEKPIVNQISAICGGDTQYLYIADSGNQCIQKILPDGTVTARWGGFGIEPGKFNEIKGIAIDRYGDIYVADSGNNRIQKFDTFGRYIMTWGEYGTGPGKFISITALGVGPGSEAGEEYIYVADSGSKKIQVFTTTGTYLTSWGEYGVFNPELIPETLDTLQIITGVSYPASYTPVKPIPNADPMEVDRNFKVLFQKGEYVITIPVNRSYYLGAKQNVDYIPDIGKGSPEYWVNHYISMYQDPVNNDTYDTILNALRGIRDSQSLSEREYIELLVTFIQQLPYKESRDTRYPIEIIHDKEGNSADKALLLLGLLEREGFLSTYIYFPKTGLCGIGIGTDPTYRSSSLAEFSTKDRNKYIFINPNKPTLIGVLDEALTSDDPFLISFSNTTEQGTALYSHINFLDHVVGTYFLLEKRMHYFEEMYTKAKDSKEKKVWQERYDKAYQVYSFIRDHPHDLAGSYTRIENSNVREMEF
ncbi:MAG: hypothetical protein JXA44_12385 [Methanospirillaceae archaeon]|nr:hypothetical protein [Methanospirillaceae archaeon]